MAVINYVFCNEYKNISCFEQHYITKQHEVVQQSVFLDDIIAFTWLFGAEMIVQHK